MAVASRKGRPFAVEIQFDGNPEKPIEIEAYLFDRAGGFLAAAPFQKGQARFALDEVPDGARLFVGPQQAALGRTGKPSLARMERLDAYEPAWKYDPDREIYQLEPIPEIYWPHWPLCSCRVRGRVVKRSTSPGGVVVEAPICEARVHICEVDPVWWVIERLPEIDIFRLRDDLLDLIKRPFPWPPIPDPDPEPDWLRGMAVNPADLGLRQAQKTAALSLFGRRAADLTPQPLPPSQAALRLPDLAQVALYSPSADIVRRGLIDHIDYLRPWLCHWDWLEPWFYRCDELRVVTTNDDGTFDTSIRYSCLGDHPDLYFWVEASVGGVWTTVYHPSVRCHTWWDYPCGTHVTIGVTDPRVSGCGDAPVLGGLNVVVKTIGNGVSMGQINRTGDPEPLGTVKSGLAPANPPLARAAPFGGLLELRVDFGTGLKPAGITHYRWSYRLNSSTNEADWRPLQDQVSRHYRETAAPGTPPIYKPVIVGPDPAVTGDYFFLVDPALPAGGEKFEVLDQHTDLVSAYWDTTKIGAENGTYALKLELFGLVGGVMTRMNLTARGVAISQITDPAPLLGPTYATELATGDRLLKVGSDVFGYLLVLHVDNRPCHGTIDSVTVSPGNNDTPCGFLEYGAGAQAMITFHASHPGNFATYQFYTNRVATNLTGASVTGYLGEAATNGFTKLGDTFSKSIPVALLLSEAFVPTEDQLLPCTRAAFAESLGVYALATNGYDRLSHLDAPKGAGEVGLRGFAVTPA